MTAGGPNKESPPHPTTDTRDHSGDQPPAEPTSGAKVEVAAPTLRATRRPGPLIRRDQHYLERAWCIDCYWLSQGRGTRKKAGAHAVRRGHRVSFSRLEAFEFRPRRWPR
jgi:hypothetical protein